jgi:putative spermidine/putrescine transport system ATP-binding protein
VRPAAESVFAQPGAGLGVELRDVVRVFPGGVRAVDRVSLDVRPGEFLTLLGPSGSGKTTTLMMIAGFEQPDEGEILIGGRPVTFVPPHRRDLGVVFQNYALFPHLNVFENIAYALRVRKVGLPEIRQRVVSALAMVKLAGFERRYPKQLSGGQQQRVALARALVFEPRVLLMDEPLGALDRRLREHMQLEIKALHQNLGITMIYVTHDQTEALVMSDRIAVMQQGRIEQVGLATDVYDTPLNRFVAEFIGESNLLAATVESATEGLVARLDGGARIAARGLERFPPGERLWLVVRPEKISMRREPADGSNCLTGKVAEVIFFGEIRRYRIRLADGGDELAVRVPNSRLAAAFQPGDEVVLCFAAMDFLAVPHHDSEGGR